MSEVIEARGHPGRESHESRASGREQCRESVIFPSLSLSLSFLPSFLPSSTRVRHVDSSFLIAALALLLLLLYSLVRFDRDREINIETNVIYDDDVRRSW